ncbi:hypothetical protein OSB04_016984 [Centaurea solstitialis]|uniref:Uncharacterized protein n=1 Tax=Centaurea solstitialis TaxID=347529 RepID=A0AA38T3Q2_9ASTR|nr:hypothetical protein OSB04_016984 [Centaurea solstitialis]
MGSNEDFAYALQLVTSISLPMVLENAMKLGVLEAIGEAGPDARLSAHEIANALSFPNQDAPGMLDRMLRLLASYSIVTCTQQVYGLAPVAKYLIQNEDGVSLRALMELIQDKVFIKSIIGTIIRVGKLKDSIVEGGVPFEKVYGQKTFEYPELDTRYNEVFNNAMVHHSTLVIKEHLKCYNGFDNIKHLVDVGGGVGVTLNMIISKYPTINGINFDLPHVIQHAPVYPGIQHIGGDMFFDVPQGDAIFLKWILHDWSDNHCTKLLQNCYKALPNDGKVIVVDAILPFLSDTSTSVRANANIDAIVMTHYFGGKERTEDEFLTLAKGAGFNGMKKKCQVCNMWVMELYKVIRVVKRSIKWSFRVSCDPQVFCTRNNNNQVSRLKARDDVNDRTLGYKCGDYGHMQRTCRITPQEVQNYHIGRKAEANLVEANKNLFLETRDFVAQME